MTRGFVTLECHLADNKVAIGTSGEIFVRPMSVVHLADGRREVAFFWQTLVWRLPLAAGKDRGVAATWAPT
jgi:hypothetical protein